MYDYSMKEIVKKDDGKKGTETYFFAIVQDIVKNNETKRWVHVEKAKKSNYKTTFNLKELHKDILNSSLCALFTSI